MKEKLVDRDKFIEDYQSFCKNHDCEVNCPYYLEDTQRGIPCSTLYVLDKLENEFKQFEIVRPDRKEGKPKTVCQLMDALHNVLDIMLGPMPGESVSDFNARKFKVLNNADELIGETESQCRK